MDLTTYHKMVLLRDVARRLSKARRMVLDDGGLKRIYNNTLFELQLIRRNSKHVPKHFINELKATTTNKVNTIVREARPKTHNVVVNFGKPKAEKKITTSIHGMKQIVFLITIPFGWTRRVGDVFYTGGDKYPDRFILDAHEYRINHRHARLYEVKLFDYATGMTETLYFTTAKVGNEMLIECGTTASRAVHAIEKKIARKVYTKMTENMEGE